MPTGRPDYWYGTALYFEENPADGEVTRGPTSNWAYDHVNDISAHHVKAVSGDINHASIVGVTAAQHHAKYLNSEAVSAMGAKADGNPLNHDKLILENEQALYLNQNRVADQQVSIYMYAKAGGGSSNNIIRYSGTNSHWDFNQGGSGKIRFYFAGQLRLELLNAGGLGGCWDDTPTNGQQNKGVTSDWAYDHVNAVAAHHSQYLDSDAISAMGVKGDANALNHDRYTDAEAELACEAIVDDTPVNGATDQPVSSNWAFDHKADANAHHTPPAPFTDRGDPSAYDIEKVSLTIDANWNDWNISSIVGAAAKLVLLRCTYNNDTLGESFGVRENGNSNAHNASMGSVVEANQYHRRDMLVMTDGSGIIEYRATNGGTWDTLSMMVRGWF